MSPTSRTYIAFIFVPHSDILILLAETSLKWIPQSDSFFFSWASLHVPEGYDIKMNMACFSFLHVTNGTNSIGRILSFTPNDDGLNMLLCPRNILVS